MAVRQSSSTSANQGDGRCHQPLLKGKSERCYDGAEQTASKKGLR
jgi:hypothetical protein